MSFNFVTQNEDQTDQLGAILADLLDDGTTVALSGTLGSGKTRLVQAIAKHCGAAPEDVLSPTFTVCNEYHGDRFIVHADLYRITDEDQLLELGLEEFFESNALVFIEWADRFPDYLPPDRIEINIECVGPTQRKFEFRCPDATPGELLESLRQRVDLS